MTAWSEGQPFRASSKPTPGERSAVEKIDEAFDLERSLRHTGRIFAALEEVEGR